MQQQADAAHTVKSFQKVALPPSQLFAAWVEPKMMEAWLFKGHNSRITRIDNDVRVGGKFSIQATRDDGKQIDHFGEYLEVQAPRRLMFTLQVPEHFEGVSVVSLDITQGDEGNSWMAFAQTGVKKEITQESWRTMFRQLQNAFAPD